MPCQVCEFVRTEVEAMGPNGSAEAWDLIMKDEKTIRAALRFLITMAAIAHMNGDLVHRRHLNGCAHRLAKTWLVKEKAKKRKGKKA